MNVNHTSENSSPFFNTAEAAVYLRMRKRTLENMRWRGEGPDFRKHGKWICYHVDDLEKWSRARARNAR